MLFIFAMNDIINVEIHVIFKLMVRVEQNYSGRAKE